MFGLLEAKLVSGVGWQAPVAELDPFCSLNCSSTASSLLDTSVSAFNNNDGEPFFFFIPVSGSLLERFLLNHRFIA